MERLLSENEIIEMLEEKKGCDNCINSKIIDIIEEFVKSCPTAFSISEMMNTIGKWLADTDDESKKEAYADVITMMYEVYTKK